MKRTDIFAEIDSMESAATEFGKLLSNLHYTHFFLMGLYNKTLEKYDLTAAQSNLLGIIYHYNPRPLSLEELKSKVLEPNSDVSRIVDRLVEKDLLEKTRDKVNGRKLAIKLSPKGIRLSQKLLNEKEFQKFTRNISPEEATVFARVLDKLRNA